MELSQDDLLVLQDLYFNEKMKIFYIKEKRLRSKMMNVTFYFKPIKRSSFMKNCDFTLTL